MDISATLPWVAAGLMSAWLCLSALNPSIQNDDSPPHTALPRPASPEEVAQLEEQATRLSVWAAEAREANGAPIPTNQIEGHLPEPIFDNPLVDGVGGIQESCPVHAMEQPALDWIYCPGTAVFKAHIPSETSPNHQSDG